MINRTPAYGLPMPEENDNYSLAVVNEVTAKVDEALGMLKENIVNISNRTNPQKNIISGTILESVLANPNCALGYRGTRATDAPPKESAHWAKVISVGEDSEFGLSVYWIYNSNILTYARTIKNGVWMEPEWQKVVSPSIAQHTAALESAMLAVLGDGNNV